jgi:hypothetical protein
MRYFLPGIILDAIVSLSEEMIPMTKTKKQKPKYKNRK